MKKIKLSLLISFLGMVSASGCFHGPDLVVTSLQAAGAPVINAQNSVEVPVQVIVKNQGRADAGAFKVSTEYTGNPIDPAKSFVVAFTVPGQANIWYPFTVSPLASGDTVTFSGKITFHPSIHGITVSVKAIADSCSGDELMPDYCRVKEKDEGNNLSAPISIALP